MFIRVIRVIRVLNFSFDTSSKNTIIMLEWFGVISGILYLWLEIKQHRWMWVVGFLTSLAYVFIFFFAKVYADMGLNIYYVVISIYGFVQWSRKVESTENAHPDETIIYRHLTLGLFVKILLATLLVFGLIWYFLSHFTDSPIPIGDACTTSIGIIATWMLAKRIVEHWIFWVVVNTLSVYLYYLRDLRPTMLLYICYAILSVLGWYSWTRKGVEQD